MAGRAASRITLFPRKGVCPASRGGQGEHSHRRGHKFESCAAHSIPHRISENFNFSGIFALEPVVDLSRLLALLSRDWPGSIIVSYAT